MSEKDYEFLLAHWKQLVEQLQDVNESLRELTISQHRTILKLQGVQTPPAQSQSTNKKGGE